LTGVEAAFVGRLLWSGFSRECIFGASKKIKSIRG